MEEIGLPLDVWDRRTGRTGWDGGGMEGSVIAGARFVSSPFDLGVRRATRSGGCHHSHWCCRGQKVFLSVQQNNHNILHTNPKYNIVKDSSNSTYDTIVL